MKKSIILIAGLVFQNALFASEARIHSEILFTESFNKIEFREQYNRSRSRLRKDYINEVADLMSLGAMPEEAKDIVSFFDNLVVSNRENSKRGISEQISANFQARLFDLYNYYQPSQGESLVVNSEIQSPSKYLIHGIFSIQNTQLFLVHMYIVNRENNTVYTLQSSGSLVQAAQSLADSLFDYFHKSKFPQVIDSQASSRFVVQSKSNVQIGALGMTEALAYERAEKKCASEKARLANESQLNEIMARGKYQGGWSEEITRYGISNWALAKRSIYKSQISRSEAVSSVNKISQLHFFCVKN